MNQSTVIDQSDVLQVGDKKITPPPPPPQKKKKKYTHKKQ